MNDRVRGCPVCDSPDSCMAALCEPEHLGQSGLISRQTGFRRGDVIHRAGDRIQYIHFIRSGLLKMEAVQPIGRNLILRLHGRGGIIGQRALWGAKRYTDTAVAVEEGDFCAFDMDALKGLYEKNTQLQVGLHRMMVEELEEAETRMMQMACLNVRQKVAQMLLTMAQKYGYAGHGEAIYVHLGRQDMADMAGTTKEQVSKVLADLESEGLLRFSAKHFHYFDLEGLTRIITRKETTEEEEGKGRGEKGTPKKPAQKAGRK